MSKNIISLDDARGLANKLITESTEIRAFFVSGDGARSIFVGRLVHFSDMLYIALGDGGYFKVPVSPECTFRFGDKREVGLSSVEEFSRMGEMALSIAFAERSQLTMFFN